MTVSDFLFVPLLDDIGMQEVWISCCVVIVVICMLIIKLFFLPSSLAFSVTLFCAEAVIAIAVMMIRRHPKIGGELGGPKVAKYITSGFLVFLWIFYVLMSTLEAYGLIPSLSASASTT